MQKKLPYTIFFLIFAVTIFSCNNYFQSQSLVYKTYTINDSMQKDTAILSFLQPYSTKVNAVMNDVVGIAAISLEKKLPESTLGNFMVDAFYFMAKEKYNQHIDAAFLNYGGIRLNQLPEGRVTTGKIFELMPFENILILQKLKGNIFQEFLDLTAARGGWPLAGISMQIKDNKAVNVLIGGKPLDPEAIYIVANSDFVANGGENADMLRSIPQISNGYLMRDAIFDYIIKLKSQGKNISAAIENRISNAK